MKQSLILVLLFASFVVNAQQENQLSLQEYLQAVLAEHPIAKNASLQSEFADAELLKAKGSLDPKFTIGQKAKEFEDTEYYTILNSELKIPTSTGLSFKAGFDNTDGTYLNPQNKTTGKGLWAAGVELDVLSGLLYNERKAALESAEVFRSLSENEQVLMLNQLLYEASLSYINWAINYEKMQVIEESVNLAQEYVTNTNSAVFVGDKPKVDSIEAKTILLDRQLTQSAFLQEYVNAKWLANQYIFEQDNVLYFQPTTVPEDLEQIPLHLQVAETITTNNPFLVEKQLKLDQLAITKRLAQENAKPDLTLGYNPLFKTDDSLFPNELNLGNYKYGVSFAMPLFFRKERAEVQKTELKITEVNNELTAKQQELIVKQNALKAEIENLEHQIQLTEQLLNENQQLLTAEEIKFDIGESSVFLLNKRQEKLLELQLKVLELQRKLHQKIVGSYYILGRSEDLLL